MRRICALVLALMLSASSVFAAVAIEKDGSAAGVATTLNFDADSAYSTNGSTFNLPMNLDLISAGIDDGGVTALATGPDAVASGYSVILANVATHTATLADGVPGQILTIIGADISDTGTLTVTATTKTGWTSVAIDASRDFVTLLYVDDTYGWIIIAQYSVSIT